MRRIGIFGGSFNPVHLGHTLAADSVCDQLALDEIRFIPAAHSPFKARPQIDDHHRIELLKLATRGNPALKIDLREMNTPGPSYTINTLRSITSDHPNDQLYLLIGMDAWPDFERWKDWTSILELCHLLVMTRPDYARPNLNATWASRHTKSIEILQSTKAGKLFFITVPPSRAASSEIRKRLNRHINTQEFLAESVATYIQQQQLYQ